MRFTLLGRVDVEVLGQSIRMDRAQRRALLAYLLLHHGRTVSVSQLIDALWGSTPPATAKAQVFAAVSAVRRMLRAHGGDLITSSPAGYLLTTAGHQFDLLNFRELVAQAQAPDSPAEAVNALRAALQLWKGTPLAGVAGAYVEPTRAQLVQEQLAAQEQLFEVELELGRHDAIIPELFALAGAQPLRERPIGQLMLALYRGGRQAEALETYRVARRRFIDELGIEPTPQLDHLHNRILLNDLDLVPAGPKIHAASAHRRFLPRDVPDFVGREQDLAQLTAFAGESPGGNAFIVSAIAGIGGVGKTALAVHWAHQATLDFPDGQLYVNLRGFQPGEAMSAAEALSVLLRALDVAGDAIPPDADEAAALYRTTLAGQKVLVLLDNAASAEQVRPLLPASPGSLVLITSRDALTGLIARDGARRITLGTLSADEAIALLRRIIGSARVTAEPDAAHELIVACGHLPLAVRIAAAILAGRPHHSIAGFTAELTDGDRLSQLQIDNDPESAVRAVLEQSYVRLSPQARRVFRLLGLIPGHDFALAAVTQLCALSNVDVVRLVHELSAAHMLSEDRPGRYRMHDLVRFFAVEQARAEEPGQAARAALIRLFSHYLSTADAAMTVVAPQTARLPLPDALPESTVTFADAADALSWLKTEHPNLVAAIQHAIGHGLPEFCWQLADVVRGYFWISRHFDDWQASSQIGLAAAGTQQNVGGQAAMHLSLGIADRTVNRLAEAIEHFETAGALARQAGWLEGEASAVNSLGIVHATRGDMHAALAGFSAALQVNRQLNRAATVAMNLGNIVVLRIWLGEVRQAIVECREALELHRQTGNRAGEALMHNNLAVALQGNGQFAAASEHLRRALALRDPADKSGRTISLTGLAQCQLHSGQLEAAQVAVAEAVQLARDAGEKQDIASALCTQGLVALRQGDLAKGAASLSEAVELATASGARLNQTESLEGLARARLAQGDQAQALRLTEQALAIAEDHGFQAARAEALSTIAAIRLSRKEFGLARAAAEAALSIAERTGYERHLARVREITAPLVDVRQ
jgi:DNA-binding SARP family transcriptional activator/tetratricopeptide (TPR) repeat protein